VPKTKTVHCDFDRDLSISNKCHSIQAFHSATNRLACDACLRLLFIGALHVKQTDNRFAAFFCCAVRNESFANLSFFMISQQREWAKSEGEAMSYTFFRLVCFACCLLFVVIVQTQEILSTQTRLACN